MEEYIKVIEYVGTSLGLTLGIYLYSFGTDNLDKAFERSYFMFVAVSVCAYRWLY